MGAWKGTGKRKTSKKADPGMLEATRSPEYSVVELTEEDVRVAAYYRWLDRGGGHGGHDKDWLEAERQLKSKAKRRKK